MQIFNRRVIEKKRDRAISHCDLFAQSNYIFTYGAKIILNLIEDLDQNQIKNILIYGSRGKNPEKYLRNYYKKAQIDSRFYKEGEALGENYDLIVSFFDIGTIDNIPLFLSCALSQLSDNGAFIGTFVGENSLINTRQKLWEHESKNFQKYSMRIWPMIRLNDFTTLLQRSGFLNVISFIENYEKEFPNLYACLKDIKYKGESGGFNNQEYFQKSLYKKILEERLSAYKENFELINFCASKSTKMFATKLDI